SDFLVGSCSENCCTLALLMWCGEDLLLALSMCLAESWTRCELRSAWGGTGGVLETKLSFPANKS
ncbi:MAG: hypothetical protein VXZ53_24200, partial [Planctomycetota bacterium]|nr:hypothetical protein [Planctomycetota bacterium]